MAGYITMLNNSLATVKTFMVAKDNFCDKIHHLKTSLSDSVKRDLFTS